MEKIVCPNCLGKGLMSDPVLQSSVVDTRCRVCEGSGRIEARYEVLSRLCKPRYKNDVLLGWECSLTTFVPASAVEGKEIPLIRKQGRGGRKAHEPTTAR